MYSLQKKTLEYRQDSRKSQNTKKLFKSVLQCHMIHSCIKYEAIC